MSWYRQGPPDEATDRGGIWTQFTICSSSKLGGGGCGLRTWHRRLDEPDAWCNRASLSFDLPCRRESDPAGPHWNVESMEPLTLSPSILCTTCGFHGFIRDGRWVPV